MPGPPPSSNGGAHHDPGAGPLGATAPPPSPGIPRRRFDAHLLAFAEELRSERLAVGTSEILDAFEALDLVEWTDQRDFKEALATTLAKSNDDRRIFDLVFDRFFFRATEAQAARKRITEAQAGGEPPGDIKLDTL